MLPKRSIIRSIYINLYINSPLQPPPLKFWGEMSGGGGGSPERAKHPGVKRHGDEMSKRGNGFGAKHPEPFLPFRVDPGFSLTQCAA